MKNETAFIFPGQGAQSVGMARDVAENSERAQRVFERADEVLGFPLSQLCFEGPEQRLEQTDIQQPAIFTASVAIWEALRERDAVPDNGWSAGGLSLGEYTALHVAGAVAFDDALRLVRRRGELMQAAADAAPSGMISLIGADETSAAALCDEARGDDVLTPANFNCPGQVVIAGSQAACDRAMALLDKYGLRGVRLAVAGAFHTRLMQSAAEQLEQVLRETAFERPRMPVVANVDAEYHGGPDDIRASLAKQVTHAVLWQRCVERLMADGITRFIEVGPGRVLTGLMRKIDRRADVLNVNGLDGIARAVEALRAT